MYIFHIKIWLLRLRIIVDRNIGFWHRRVNAATLPWTTTLNGNVSFRAVLSTRVDSVV